MGATGWNAPSSAPWFENALNAASQNFFGAPCGTIPPMGLLSPKSNAHGPNEFLHVPYAKKLTAAVAQVIASVPG